MARIRTIKPEFWSDESISSTHLSARLLFIGILNLADDYGICRGNVKWIKAQLFPYDDNIRITEVSQWIDQLIKARMLVPFTIEDEGYLYVRTFNVHQRIEKPSKNGTISSEKLQRALKLEETPESFREYSEHVPRLVGEYSGSTTGILPVGKEGKGKGKEKEGKVNSPIGDDGSDDPPMDCFYKDVVKDKEGIYTFIRDQKPKDIQPYVDFWNLFATELKYPQVSKLTDSRKRKFASRIKDPAFDFPAILRKAKASKFLSEGNWFTFDWIIENENNFLKLLEGKYDTKQPVEESKGAVSNHREEDGRRIIAESLK